MAIITQFKLFGECGLGLRAKWTCLGLCLLPCLQGWDCPPNGMFESAECTHLPHILLLPLNWVKEGRKESIP